MKTTGQGSAAVIGHGTAINHKVFVRNQAFNGSCNTEHARELEGFIHSDRTAKVLVHPSGADPEAHRSRAATFLHTCE